MMIEFSDCFEFTGEMLTNSLVHSQCYALAKLKGLASRPKWKTCVDLGPFGHIFYAVALTCAHFIRDQICSQAVPTFHRMATQSKSMQSE